MKATLDASGRLVIPKEIRRLAGLRPGMSLDVRWQDGRIEIEPVAAPVRLVQKGRFLVAVHDPAVGEITAELVEATRQAIADERFTEIMGSAPVSPRQ
jgi:AbrB family looped-hinge helix DNA binding protein